MNGETEMINNTYLSNVHEVFDAHYLLLWKEDNFIGTAG